MLWLVWRPGADPAASDMAIKTAALLSAIPWVPFFPALATPGTAVEDEPGHLHRIAGVPANLVPATLIPAIAGRATCYIAADYRGRPTGEFRYVRTMPAWRGSASPICHPRERNDD